MMPGRSVGRRGDHPAAGRVLLVDGQREQRRPTPSRAAGRPTSRGAPPAARAGRAARRRTLSPPGRTPVASAAARHALLHDRPDVPAAPARTSVLGAPRQLVGQHHAADRQAGRACCARAARRRCWNGYGTGVASGTIARPARPRPRPARNRHRPSSRCARGSSAPSASSAAKRIPLVWNVQPLAPVQDDVRRPGRMSISCPAGKRQRPARGPASTAGPAATGSTVSGCLAQRAPASPP